MAEVDLHLHTTCSDGRLTPTQLVELVAARGIVVAAITDHDSTEGLPEALKAASRFPQLTIIPGVELSTDIPGNEIHVLGYFIRYEDAAFQETLRSFRDGRVDRAREMVDKLAALGLPVDWERVCELAQGAVGRPHIAQAMVEKGYISYPQEAFTHYIGRNGPAYAERDKMTPAEAVEYILGVVAFRSLRILTLSMTWNPCCRSLRRPAWLAWKCTTRSTRRRRWRRLRPWPPGTACFPAAAATTTRSARLARRSRGHRGRRSRLLTGCERWPPRCRRRGREAVPVVSRTTGTCVQSRQTGPIFPLAGTGVRVTRPLQRCRPG